MSKSERGGYIENRGCPPGTNRGGGRKKRSEPIVTYSVDITHEQADLLKMWGGGDLSAGLRWLVDAAGVFIGKYQGGATHGG